MIRNRIFKILIILLVVSIVTNKVGADPDWSCGDLLVDSRDGKSYTTVLIGTQCWMQQNLNIGTMVSDTTTLGTSAVDVEKYCYSNSESNCNTDGGLYSWDQAMAGSTTPGAQGICPVGWHIPSDDEWKKMEIYLGMSSYDSNLLSAWRYSGSVGSDLSTLTSYGSNSSGFTALLAGWRFVDGGFGLRNGSTNFWSSNEYTSSVALDRSLRSNESGILRSTHDKRHGSSVRCLNSEIISPTEDLYVIGFDSSGGNLLNDIIDYEGAAVTPPTSPTKTGYSFTGWSPALPATMPATNQMHTALWSINQYTLTFDTEGGSTVSSITQNYDTTITPPANPTKAGYTFAGWSPGIPSNMPAQNQTHTALWNEAVSSFTCGSEIVDTRDGQTYPTVQIGTQCWMKENLNVGSMMISPISYTGISPNTQGTNAINVRKFCYGNNESNCNVYGGLYQWNQAMAGSNDPGARGICPAGWHIPTDDEWKSLEVHLGMTGTEVNSTNWRGTNEGTKLKANLSGYNGTNSSGFTGLLAGVNAGIGSSPYHDLGRSGDFWSSDSRSTEWSTLAWRRSLLSTWPTVQRLETGIRSAHSVRCIKSEDLNSSLDQYELTFNTDSEISIDSIIDYYGSPIIPPIEPTKEGYIFVGWSPEIPETMPNSNQTHTAIWEIQQFSLLFHPEGGNMDEIIIIDDFGATIIPPNEPVKDGYTFTGWSPSLPLNMPTDNPMHKAQWAINQYTLTFDTDGGSSVSSITQNYNTAINPPANPAKEGYNFAGWSPAIPSTVPATNQTHAAVWTIDQFALTFDTDGGSMVNAIIDDFGAVVTLPADPIKRGYNFLGWFPAIPSTMLAVNQTHTALWEEIQTRRKTSTSVATRIMNLQNMGNTTEANRLRQLYNAEQSDIPKQPLSIVEIINLLISLNIITGENVIRAKELINAIEASNGEFSISTNIFNTQNTTSTNSNSDENPIPTFTQNLERGSTHSEVLKLQNFLTKKGYMTVTPNGHFGPATEAALIQFQKDNNISPAVGYFGPVTRRVVNSI